MSVRGTRSTRRRSNPRREAIRDATPDIQPPNQIKKMKRRRPTAESEEEEREEEEEEEEEEDKDDE